MKNFYPISFIVILVFLFGSCSSDHSIRVKNSLVSGSVGKIVIRPTNVISGNQPYVPGQVDFGSIKKDSVTPYKPIKAGNFIVGGFILGKITSPFPKNQNIKGTLDIKGLFPTKWTIELYGEGKFILRKGNK